MLPVVGYEAGGFAFKAFEMACLDGATNVNDLRTSFSCVGASDEKGGEPDDSEDDDAMKVASTKAHEFDREAAVELSSLHGAAARYVDESTGERSYVMHIRYSVDGEHRS